MPRRRDPQQLLVKARKMEAEARKIREEAERLRREREAREDQRAGQALRRFWKQGWAGVALADVVGETNAVFGEPTSDGGGGWPGTDSDKVREGRGVKVETGPPAAAGGLPGDLFGEGGGRSHAGS